MAASSSSSPLDPHHQSPQIHETPRATIQPCRTRMSQSDVVYSCGSCGYPLNLSSSNRSTSDVGSSYQKSVKKGLISFITVDLSRFTQVDEISCFPLTWRSYRPKTKLLCRKCGASIGYGYGEPAVLCSFDPASSSSSTSQKYLIKIQALQPSDSTQ
ncbi:hypothetical protein DAI22_11g097200 [Oryza sativa Japonica Group]|nr:hypothetical protein DAI22_11g097200 [Oryza sativa Japonica Group]